MCQLLLAISWGGGSGASLIDLLDLAALIPPERRTSLSWPVGLMPWSRCSLRQSVEELGSLQPIAPPGWVVIKKESKSVGCYQTKVGFDSLTNERSPRSAGREPVITPPERVVIKKRNISSVKQKLRITSNFES